MADAGLTLIPGKAAASTRLRGPKGSDPPYGLSSEHRLEKRLRRSLAMSVLSAGTARRTLFALYAINAVAAAAAAIVLALAPDTIPSMAGIAIDPSQNLIPYLLAAAELAIATLAALALRSRSTEVKRLAIGVLIIFHAGSAVAGVAAVTQGAGAVVELNVAVRVMMIAALAACAPGRMVGSP